VVGDATLNRFFALHVIAAAAGAAVAGGAASGWRCTKSAPTTPTASRSRRSRTRKPASRQGRHRLPPVLHGEGPVRGWFLPHHRGFILFFAPEFGGLFLEHDNFVMADPMVTPEHIKPVWYFTPYYAMLRAIYYFAFFLSMPIWSRMGTFKAVPERVTTHD
jgi:ubiquinol-cytochrome c reductase cytochrome b subunit